MKKGKIFTILCVGVLIVGGFFLSQNINVQGSNSSQQVNQSTQYENVSIENANQDTQITNVVYDVIFIDFNDQTCINGRLNQTFDDYIKTYNTVTDYIYLLSNHKVNMVFNYYNYKIDANASEVTHAETYACDGFISKYYYDLLANRQSLQINGDGSSLTIFQFASEYTIKSSQFGWSSYFTFCDHHTGAFQGAIRLVDGKTSLTILHEIMHSFGLLDLYSYVNHDTCTLSYDVLACQYGLYPTINAYMRESLDWISSSSYEDEQKTEIEYINESGRYRLYYPNILNQTIAYSFGTKNKETFYIEARTENNNSTKLVVNRVNKEKGWNNAQATNKSECYIIDVAEINKTNSLISTDGTPSAKNVIYYANGDYANYAIGNVTFNDNCLEFDFSTTGNFDFSLQVNAIDSSGNKLAKALVYVNDEYVGSTNSRGILDCQVSVNDVVTVLHPDTKNSQQYTVVKGTTSKTFVYDVIKQSKSNISNSEKIVVNESVTSMYTLNITFTQNISDSSLLNYYYLDSSLLRDANMQVYADNTLVTANYDESYTINLKDKSNISIYTKQKSIYYTFDTSSKTLYNTTTCARIYCQNNTFSVNINVETIKYTLYLKVKGNDNKHVGITGMMAYNSTTDNWEVLSCISDYTECSPMTIYLTSDYTMIEYDYQNWFDCQSMYFAISFPNKSYIIYIEQNIIQSGLDWFVNLFK